MGPYAGAFQLYWENGWRGVLPLPLGRKTWPPAGTTGRDGLDPSYPDCAAWAETGPNNIALRLPPHIIGVDVDNYDGKPGAQTLAQLVDQHGALPATWLSTSRDDGISGIRLYTKPGNLELVSGLPGIEIIQRHHRYVVCHPSIHPSGSTYQWVDERTGEIGVPAVDSIPPLPGTWVAALQHPDGHRAKNTGADLTVVWMGLPAGEPCTHIQAAAGRVFDGRARHDSYNTAVLAALGHARRGCPGAHTTIPRLYQAFLAEVVQPGQRTRGEAEAEWSRNLEGALRIIAAEPQGGTCTDDLASWAFPKEEPEQPDPAVVVEYTKKVHLKALDLRIVEDARTLLASSAAQTQPAPESDPLDVFLNQPDTDIPWRVQGLWAAAGRVLLPAAAKAGKTTLIGRNLLPCLADGGMFLGKFHVTPHEGAIVYLNLEVGADTIRRWLRTTRIQNPQRVHIANLRGQASRINIGTPAGRKRFARWLSGLGAETVILDPLAPLLAALGLDEDNNGQIAAFFNMWNETLQQAGVSEDLISHHTGHDGQRSRGASRLLDEPDAVWTITRPKPPPNGPDEDNDTDPQSEHRFISATGRDVELHRSGLHFNPDDGKMTIIEGSPAQIRRQLSESDYERRVLAAINRAGPEGLGRWAVRRTEGKEALLMEALDRLVKRGTVMEEDLGRGRGYKYWTLFKPPSESHPK